MISFCLPVLDEEFFLPIFLRNISPLQGFELVITDGGSTDKTVTIIENFAEFNPDIRVDLKIAPQTGQPYSKAWNEGEVRNDLFQRCQGEYIVRLDVDELVEPCDIVSAIEQLKAQDKILASFKDIPYWIDLHHIRVSIPASPPWYGETGVRRRVLKNDGGWSHGRKVHTILMRGEHRYPKDASVNTGLLLHHIHYGFGTKGTKEFDNRRGDMTDGMPDAVGPKIGMQEWDGPWPKVLEQYL